MDDLWTGWGDAGRSHSCLAAALWRHRHLRWPVGVGTPCNPDHGQGPHAHHTFQVSSLLSACMGAWICMSCFTENKFDSRHACTLSIFINCVCFKRFLFPFLGYHCNYGFFLIQAALAAPVHLQKQHFSSNSSELGPKEFASPSRS